LQTDNETPHTTEKEYGQVQAEITQCPTEAYGLVPYEVTQGHEEGYGLVPYEVTASHDWVTVFVKGTNGKTTSHTISLDSRVEMLMKRLQMPIEFQMLYYGGKCMNPLKTLREQGVCDASTMHLMMRLVGGAKVIKHTIKHRSTARVVPEDKQAFDTIFITCMSIMDASKMDIPGELNKLSHAQLSNVLEFLENRTGKTTLTNKVRMLYQFMPAYVVLDDATKKLAAATAKLRELYEADLEDRFYSDEGTLEFEKLVRLVTVLLTRKESAASSSSTGDIAM
jgi:hypothetical protein